MELSSTMSDADGSAADGSAADPAESPAPADDRYRSHFAAWLGGMSEEARQLAFLLERQEASAPLRRLAADSLNQLLHAADMLPEGTEALGYLETLFAFRLLAAEQSEAAYSSPRLPKPRLPKAEPATVRHAEVEPAPTVAPPEAEPEGAAELAESSEAQGTQPMAAEEPVEALAAEAAGAEGERVAVELPAAGLPEAEPMEVGAGETEASESEASEVEEGIDVAAEEVAQLEEEPEEEPERAQASDESYAIARRLAPQAALVRAFLGADDAERLRRLVLEQRNRASRGRSSKEILLDTEARAAAASDARDWAELYETPEFGSMQHDLLRLRTFMKTRVRRGAS